MAENNKITQTSMHPQPPSSPTHKINTGGKNIVLKTDRSEIELEYAHVGILTDDCGEGVFPDGTEYILLEEGLGPECKWDRIKIEDSSWYIYNQYATLLGLPAEEGETPPEETLIYDCSSTRQHGPYEGPYEYVHNWTEQEVGRPYYEFKAKKWLVSVELPYTAPGGSELKNRMISAIPDGLLIILEENGKQAGDDIIDPILWSKYAYLYAVAEEYYIDPRPGSNLRILVTFPDKYLLKIPDVDTSIIEKNREDRIFRTISLINGTYEEKIESAANIMRYYSQVINENYLGTVKFVDLLDEANKLESVPSQIDILLNKNNIVTTEDTMIEISLDEDGEIYDVYENSTGVFKPVLRGLNTFIESTPINSKRTLNYLLYLWDLALLEQYSDDTPWNEFLALYTAYPKATIDPTRRSGTAPGDISGNTADLEGIKSGLQLYNEAMGFVSSFVDRTACPTPPGEEGVDYPFAGEGLMQFHWRRFKSIEWSEIPGDIGSGVVSAAQAPFRAIYDWDTGENIAGTIAEGAVATYKATSDTVSSGLTTARDELFNRGDVKSVDSETGEVSYNYSFALFDEMGEDFDRYSEQQTEWFVDYVGDKLINIPELKKKFDKMKERQAAGDSATILDEVYEEILDKICLGDLVIPMMACIKVPNLTEEGERLYQTLKELSKIFICRDPNNPCDISVHFRWPYFEPRNILKEIKKIIRKSIEDLLVKMFVTIVMALVQSILDMCPKDEDPEGAGDNPTIIDRINAANPNNDAVSATLADAMAALGVPSDGSLPAEELRKIKEDFGSLLDLLSSVLTSKEMCRMFEGIGAETTLNLIKSIVKTQYPDTLYKHLKSKNDVRNLFIILGNSVDSEMCKSIAELADTHVNPSYKCPINASTESLAELERHLTSLGDDITQGQIDELLSQAADREKKSMSELADVLDMMLAAAKGENPFEAFLSDGCAEEDAAEGKKAPDGSPPVSIAALALSHESFDYADSIMLDTLFSPVYDAFNADAKKGMASFTEKREITVNIPKEVVMESDGDSEVMPHPKLAELRSSGVDVQAIMDDDDVYTVPIQMTITEGSPTTKSILSNLESSDSFIPQMDAEGLYYELILPSGTQSTDNAAQKVKSIIEKLQATPEVTINGASVGPDTPGWLSELSDKINEIDEEDTDKQWRLRMKIPYQDPGEERLIDDEYIIEIFFGTPENIFNPIKIPSPSGNFRTIPRGFRKKLEKNIDSNIELFIEEELQYGSGDLPMIKINLNMEQLESTPVIESSDLPTNERGQIDMSLAQCAITDAGAALLDEIKEWDGSDFVDLANRVLAISDCTLIYEIKDLYESDNSKYQKLWGMLEDSHDNCLISQFGQEFILPPPQAVFGKYIHYRVDTDLSEVSNEQVNSNTINDFGRNIENHFAKEVYPNIAKDIMSMISRQISNSVLFDSTPAGTPNTEPEFDQQIPNMTKISLDRTASYEEKACGVNPHLLNPQCYKSEAKSNMSSKRCLARDAKNRNSDGSPRKTTSSTENAILDPTVKMTIRAYMIDYVSRGLFPLTEFALERDIDGYVLEFYVKRMLSEMDKYDPTYSMKFINQADSVYSKLVKAGKISEELPIGLPEDDTTLGLRAITRHILSGVYMDMGEVIRKDLGYTRRTSQPLERLVNEWLPLFDLPSPDNPRLTRFSKLGTSLETLKDSLAEDAIDYDTATLLYKESKAAYDKIIKNDGPDSIARAFGNGLVQDAINKVKDLLKELESLPYSHWDKKHYKITTGGQLLPEAAECDSVKKTDTGNSINRSSAFRTYVASGISEPASAIMAWGVVEELNNNTDPDLWGKCYDEDFWSSKPRTKEQKAFLWNKVKRIRKELTGYDSGVNPPGAGLLYWVHKNGTDMAEIEDRYEQAFRAKEDLVLAYESEWGSNPTLVGTGGEDPILLQQHLRDARAILANKDSSSSAKRAARVRMKIVMEQIAILEEYGNQNLDTLITQSGGLAKQNLNLLTKIKSINGEASFDLSNGNFFLERYWKIQRKSEEEIRESLRDSLLEQKISIILTNLDIACRQHLTLDHNDVEYFNVEYFERKLPECLVNFSSSLIDSGLDLENYPEVDKIENFFKEISSGLRMVYLPPTTDDNWSQNLSGDGYGQYISAAAGQDKIGKMIRDMSNDNTITPLLQRLRDNKKAYSIIEKEVRQTARGGSTLIYEYAENTSEVVSTTRVNNTIDQFGEEVVRREVHPIPLVDTGWSEAGDSSWWGVNSGMSISTPIEPHFYTNVLQEKLIKSTEFNLLFKFVFPVDKYISFLNVYNFMAISQNSAVERNWSRTKYQLYKLFNLLSRGGDWKFPEIPNVGTHTEPFIPPFQCFTINGESISKEDLFEGNFAIEGNDWENPFDKEFALMVEQMVIDATIQLVISIFQLLAEFTDPNIMVAKMIRGLIKSVGCEAPRQALISLALLPTNIFFPFGYGPPISPTGIVYYALGFPEKPLWYFDEGDNFYEFMAEKKEDWENAAGDRWDVSDDDAANRRQIVYNDIYCPEDPCDVEAVHAVKRPPVDADE